MRHTYIVTYDIRDPKRLRKVYKLMLGWGEHLQLSVFQCELNDRELIELRADLAKVIRATLDQVVVGADAFVLRGVVFDLNGTLVFGASEPKAGAIESAGRALECPGLNHRLVVVSGVLAKECADLVQGFFRARR